MNSYVLTCDGSELTFPKYVEAVYAATNQKSLSVEQRRKLKREGALAEFGIFIKRIKDPNTKSDECLFGEL